MTNKKDESPVYIDKLTPEQEARLPEYADKWIAIGKSTAPADRFKAAEGIRDIYVDAGRKEPEYIVWCNSPMELTTLYSLAKEETEALKIIQKYNPHIDKAKYRERIILDSIRNLNPKPYRTSTEFLAGLINRRFDILESDATEAASELIEVIKESVSSVSYECGYGQHDANWLAFYDYFNEVVGLKEQTKALKGWWTIAKSAGWVLPCNNVCFIAERPVSVHLDEENRLHNYDEPAMLYPDGWGVYYMHGVRVPAEYVLTKAEDIDSKAVLELNNEEQKMVIIDKVGLTNFMGKVDHKVISEANGNKLIEFNLDEPRRGLLVNWTDMHSTKNTIIPVWRTLEEFKEYNVSEEFPEDFPDDPDDCEQVRINTFKGFVHLAKQEAKKEGKHWMECITWIAET